MPYMWCDVLWVHFIERHVYWRQPFASAVCKCVGYFGVWMYIPCVRTVHCNRSVPCAAVDINADIYHKMIIQNCAVCGCWFCRIENTAFNPDCNILMKRDTYLGFTLMHGCTNRITRIIPIQLRFLFHFFFSFFFDWAMIFFLIPSNQ